MVAATPRDERKEPFDQPKQKNKKPKTQSNKKIEKNAGFSVSAKIHPFKDDENLKLHILF